MLLTSGIPKKASWLIITFSDQSKSQPDCRKKHLMLLFGLLKVTKNY